MRKIIQIFGIIFFTILCISMSSASKFNPIGKWKCTNIEPWNEKEVIIDPLKDSYDSQMIFYSNNKFLRITNGKKINGTYDFIKDHKLRLYEFDEEGEIESTFTMRWEKGTNDPYFSTPEIDFELFDVMQVRKESGQEVQTLVRCIYTRV